MSAADTPQSLTPSKSLLRLQARSRSLPRESHNPEPSVSYLQEGQDGLLLPEGSVTEETVELLHEFVHPSHRNKHRAQTEDTLVTETLESQRYEVYPEDDSDDDDNEEDSDSVKSRPWYRRPSPMWLLSITPISAIAMSACAAPRIEIYTLLACWEHRPEYTAGKYHSGIELNGMIDALPIANFEGENVPLFNGSSSPISNLGMTFGAEGEMFTTLDSFKDTNKCASDPVVQAAAAKIIAVMTTTMGILGCLTTAFWGSLSDRYGRLWVLSISVVGLLLNDFIFIAVYFFSKQLPGGYWFLLLGPIIEGFLGGVTSMIAAVHAYIADVSAPGDRSRQFSLGAGLLFVGMALGPTIGALLVHLTHTPMAVFYLATAVHALFVFYNWFIVPESLPKSVQMANRRRLGRRRVEAARTEERESREQDVGWKDKYIRVLGKTKSVFSFLSPLSVFAPKVVEVGVPGAHCLGKTRRDWSLTFIALSYGFSGFVLASYQYKFQYAAATFGWTSEELGYWLSLVGASRAIYLTLMLPLIIKFFNRPKQAIELPIEPSEPLHNTMPSDPSSSTLVDSSPSSLSPNTLPPFSSTQSKSHSRAREDAPSTLTPHTSTFDLRLARFSLAWEVICYALIPLAPSATVFSVFGCLAAWGGGFGPAVQALALETYVRRNGGKAETGRLFGAMSVVQSMCSQIFGPTLFGLTYIRTVSRFPTAIFWLSTLCIGFAMLCMLLVRLPAPGRDSGGHIPGHISESSQVRDADADVEDAVGLEREVTLVDFLGEDGSDDYERNNDVIRNCDGAKGDAKSPKPPPLYV